MTLGFTVVETVMLPQWWPVPAGARELHRARLWALENRRFSFPQGVWGIYMWIYVHLGVYVHECQYSYVCVWEDAWTGGCMCVQMWLQDSKSCFFPMDARNPVHWQYSVKPLLAELGPEVLGTRVHHFCWEFCASMMPFKMGLVTGLGGPWGAPCCRAVLAFLVWQLCLVALLGNIPAIAENTCLSWEAGGPRQEYLCAFLTLVSDKRLCN